MFRIHIARNRQSIGEFTPEEVAEGLQTGKFLPTDLGWREPMTVWKALEEWDNLPSVNLTPPPLAAPAVPESTTPPVPATVEPAWERRADLGIIPALYESLRQIFSNTAGTFRAMPHTGGLAGPLFFYSILGILGSWAYLAFQAVAYYINPAMLETLPKTFTPSMVVASQIATAIVAPGFVILGAFIMGGAFHFTLKALGVESTFEASFRTFCYAAGAAAVFHFIPMCGFYVFWGVLVMLLTFGYREVYRISTWQAMIASTVPIMLCCGLSIASMAAVLGASLGGALK